MTLRTDNPAECLNTAIVVIERYHHLMGNDEAAAVEAATVLSRLHAQHWQSINELGEK